MENNERVWSNNEQINDEGLKLSDIWAMIWGHKWTYIISVAFCLFVGVVIVYKTPSTYKRISKVIVDESDANSAMNELTSFASSMRGFRRTGPNVYNEMESFTSPDLMQVVVERLDLQTSYVEKQFLRTRELYTNTPVFLSLQGENPTSFFKMRICPKKDSTFVLTDFIIGPKGDEIDKTKVNGRFGEVLSTPIGKVSFTKSAISTQDFDKDIEITWANSRSRAKQYASHFSATLSGKESSVIVLSVNDVFPNRADRILNTIIDVYDEEWVTNKNRSACHTTKFINDRLVVIQNELGGVENELKKYKEENKITDIASVSEVYLKESSGYASKAFEVNNQLSIAKFIKEYLADPNHMGSLIPANSGLTNMNIEQQIGEYNEIVLNRDRLLKNSSNKNPMVIDLNNSLESLRSAIDRSVDNLIVTLSLQLDKIQSQEDEILGRIASTSGQELKLISIGRQQKVKEQLYIYLLQKREENEIASLVNVSNTRVIMSPNGSNAPISPRRMMILLAAMLLGGALPFGFYLLMDALDTRVKGKKDFDQIKVPFLAEIPQIGVHGSWFSRLRQNKQNNDNCRILVHGGERDAINEAFRVLRTNLDLMIGGTKKPGEAVKIMLTSFNPNAGKTFTVMNMASVMSLKGAKVLLLDVDLRKATLSKAIGENVHGYVSYLNGKENDYRGHIKNISSSLSVLPIGVLPPNPSELILSENFTKMMDELSKEYDYIFIDCPPVDVVADTGEIAKLADLSIFIIRAQYFDKRALPLLNELYDSKKYNRMCVMLNGVESFTSGYGRYGYGYGYGFGYGNNNA